MAGSMTDVTPAPVHPRLVVIADEGRADGLDLIAPETGAWLHALAVSNGVRRVLEIGTAIGYSTLWLATALPRDGMIITMEADPALAGRARAHLAAAGYRDRISVVVGDATRFLHKVAGPFDLIFQDSAPALYGSMHDRLVALLGANGVLVTDNIVASSDHDPVVTFGHRLAAEPRLHTSFLPVGNGVAVSVKRAS